MAPKSHQDIPAELAAALRKDAARRCERTAEFWARQQTRIRLRITEVRPVRLHPVRLALVAAALMLCVVLVADRGSKPAPPPSQQVHIDADQELLLAIERSLAAGTPRALQPVALVNDSDSKNVSDFTKEQQNEN